MDPNDTENAGGTQAPAEDLATRLAELKAAGAFPHEDDETAAAEGETNEEEEPADGADASDEGDPEGEDGDDDEQGDDEEGDDDEGDGDDLPLNLDPANEILTKAGVDPANARAELAKDGKLSEATLESLEKAGYPRALVNAYVQGQMAQVAAYETSVQGLVGGAEQYGKLIDWASKNLTPGEVDAFDKAVMSGDLSAATFAVKAVEARMGATKVRKPTKQVQGRTAAALTGFADQGAMMAAMNDPRYQTDANYRRQVERRVGLSSF